MCLFSLPRWSKTCFDVLFFVISIYDQVACALLMAGEDLANHVDVKNILIEMGTYFQVQVSSVLHHHLVVTGLFKGKKKMHFFLLSFRLLVTKSFPFWCFIKNRTNYVAAFSFSPDNLPRLCFDYFFFPCLIGWLSGLFWAPRCHWQGMLQDYILLASFSSMLYE